MRAPEPEAGCFVGDPDGLELVAVRLERMARGSATATALLRAVDPQAWQGPAADAFRGRVTELLAALDDAGQAFAVATVAVRHVARALEQARLAARRADELDAAANAATRRWQAERAAWAARGDDVPIGPGLGPGPTDPGGADRELANWLRAEARAQLEGAARQAAAQLDSAAGLAPRAPSLLDRLGGAYTSYYRGVGEGAVGLAQEAWAGSSARFLVDPAGWVRDQRQLADAAAWALDDPQAFLLAALDLPMWRHDPARAAGRVTPGVAVSAATGGTGLVAVTEYRTTAPLRAVAKGGWAGQRGLYLKVKENAAAEQLLDAAVRAEADITAAMRKVQATLSHSQLSGLEHVLKGADSLKEKIAGDLHGGMLRSRALNRSLPRISDSVRYTLVTDDAFYLGQVEDAFALLRDSGYEHLTTKNAWPGPGYKGINTTWEDPLTRHRFEVQFHTPASLAAKEAEHRTYELKRALERAGLAGSVELDRLSESFYADVPVPRGATGVPEVRR